MGPAPGIRQKHGGGPVRICGNRPAHRVALPALALAQMRAPESQSAARLLRTNTASLGTSSRPWPDARSGTRAAVSPGGVIFWAVPDSPLSLIEFPADDPARARRFWAELLGVELEARQDAEGEGW